ncbi:MAG: MBL fold metallo-hydrolase [Synoicihabitans sp.]
MSNTPLSRRGFLTTSAATLAVATTAGSRLTGATPSSSGLTRGPFVYPFRIGEVEAWSISDASSMLNAGLDLMWPVEERPAMKTAMQQHGEPDGGIPLYVNVLVLRRGREVILFDAGFGERDNKNLGWLQDGLAQIGIAPDQVTAGFLSHAHGDHIDGFVQDGKPVFPNAAFHVLPAERDFWRSPNPDFSESKRNKKPLPRMVERNRENFDILEPVTVLLRDGDELFDGLVRVEAAPGHTAGHCCFRIRSDGEELLHLMDLAHHHLLMFADPNWGISFDHHPQQAIATRKKFWEQAAHEHTRCYGFHLPWPGIGKIVPEGHGYRWWPEAWRWQSEA